MILQKIGKILFIRVKELKDKNIPIVGVFCTFFPSELAFAAGASCISLCSTSDETIPVAEKDLPKNICPLIKSSYGFAITDKCPFFYFSDIVIGETTCDGKKKMYEYLGNFKDVHVMQLPNSISPEAKKLWMAEIVKCKKILEEKFETSITDEKLKEAIKVVNNERSALKKFYNLMTADKLPMKGLDLWHVLEGIQYEFDKTVIPEYIDEVIEKIKAENNEYTGERILITGCPIGKATEKVIEAVERTGAIVVAFENCGGAKANDLNVDENNPDLIEALADKYLKIGCACISPNPNRIELLTRMIKDFKVDAVIDMHLTACQPFQMESKSIKELSEILGVRYMAVETDYSTSDIGGLNTRIEAFIEML